MIEGGAGVINSLLQPEYFEVIDSVIVTIAPVWLGQGGVVVSPARSDERKAAVRLADVSWKQFGQDVVMCGKIQQ
jgi:2,5-diamino-6-(ribosylamino)-4(3H)-pyrimidinone 5'-phosphate reductase